MGFLMFSLELWEFKSGADWGGGWDEGITVLDPVLKVRGHDRGIYPSPFKCDPEKSLSMKGRYFNVLPTIHTVLSYFQAKFT